MYFYVCILGAEVYERLNRHRQEDKARRKMLDDILVHIQVKSREILSSLSSCYCCREASERGTNSEKR